jgi:hypothetical protein
MYCVFAHVLTSICDTRIGDVIVDDIVDSTRPGLDRKSCSKRRKNCLLHKHSLPLSFSPSSVCLRIISTIGQTPRAYEMTGLC